MSCTHQNTITKKYLGSSDTYEFCLDCLEAFGGEETPTKKALIRCSAQADDLFGVCVESS